MPTFHKGDMMSVFADVDHFIVLCPSLVRKDGTAQMLNDAAGQLTAIHPTLPKTIGDWLTGLGIQVHNYALRCENKVGLFQNAIMPRDGTNLACLSAACAALKELALANPDKVYALDAPGKSDPWFLVSAPLLGLPDNVQIWNANK